jgi:hypothetical protein
MRPNPQLIARVFSPRPIMTKKLAALAVLLVAGGCRMASDCCDYSSPVPGGLPMGSVRSGSVLSGGVPVDDDDAITVAAPIETKNQTAPVTPPTAPAMPH